MLTVVTNAISSFKLFLNSISLQRMHTIKSHLSRIKTSNRMFAYKISIIRSIYHNLTLISILITFSFNYISISKLNTYTSLILTTLSFMIMFMVITKNFIYIITFWCFTNRNYSTTISNNKRHIPVPP